MQNKAKPLFNTLLNIHVFFKNQYNPAEAKMFLTLPKKKAQLFLLVLNFFLKAQSLSLLKKALFLRLLAI